MKKYIYMAVAAIAALSSCSSGNDPIMGETGKQALTFTASMEGNGATSRAMYDGDQKCASWEAGDQISINGKTYNAQSAGLTTTFRAATEGEEAEGSSYEAYFPADLYDDGWAILPAVVNETWADGKFNMPMYATSTTTDLAFKNLCGVLKITVKSDQIATVKKIKVSSADKNVSGEFSVVDNAAVLDDCYYYYIRPHALTVIYSEPVTITQDGQVFYVAVPAQTYQRLKIELDADGSGFTKFMTTKSEKDITVERNKIYSITFADNAPVTTGIAKRKDGTDVKWVQLWENGPKFAEYNVGASSATDLGDEMIFTDAIRIGADDIWGANWCTPSKQDMEQLVIAAYGSDDGIGDKVKVEHIQVDGQYGYKFTGLTDFYTNNSVFFPGQENSDYSEYTDYWSATPDDSDDSKAWCMGLVWERIGPDFCIWMSSWVSWSQDRYCLVRPVLK